MSSFHLKIVSMDGLFFDDEVKQVSLRALDGEVSILPRHIPYLNGIAAGECRVYVEGEKEPRRAACIGGFLNVANEQVLIAATTFEWAEDINIDRAEKAKLRAEDVISSDNASVHDKDIARIKLKRANARLQVIENSKGNHIKI